MDLLKPKSTTLHSENPYRLHPKEEILQKNPQRSPKEKTILKALGILATLSAAFMTYQYYGATPNKSLHNPILEPIGTTLKVGALALFTSLAVIAKTYLPSSIKRGLDPSETHEKKEDETTQKLNDEEIILLKYSIDVLVQTNQLEQLPTLIKKTYLENNLELMNHLQNCVLNLKKDFDLANLTSRKKLLFRETLKILNFIVDHQVPSSSTFIKKFIPDQIGSMFGNFIWQKDEESTKLIYQMFALNYRVIAKQIEIFFSLEIDEKTKKEAYIRIFHLLEAELIDAGVTYSYTNFIHDSPKLAWQFAQLCLEEDYLNSKVNNNAANRIVLNSYEEDKDLKNVIIAKAKNCLFANKNEHAAAFAIRCTQRELGTNSELTSLENLKLLYFKLCDRSCLNQSDEDLLDDNDIQQNEKALAFSLIKWAREIHQFASAYDSEDETSSQEIEFINNKTLVLTGS